MKKVVSLLLAAVMTAGMMTGCTNSSKKAGNDGKTTITIGGWPKEKDASLDAYEKLKDEFMKKNPDIIIKTDDWGWDPSGFMTKAAAGQLPDVYVTAYTEIQKIINTGYAMDITEYMEKYEYTKYINDNTKEVVSQDGKIYAVPENAYIMGLFININLFKKAGLMNEDGTPKIPKTWDEVGEFSQIIRNKTGVPGFILPTMTNCGGWHFMNIAWAYGVNHQFMTQKGDKWKADFAGKEGAAALSFIQDLKFKYNALPEDALVKPDKLGKDFAADRVAMYLGTPAADVLRDLASYGMDKSNLAVASMPEGPAGKFTQLGGNIRVLKKGLSDAQVDAIFKWFDFIGMSPNITDDSKKSREEVVKANSEASQLVGVKTFSIWNQEGDVPDVQKFENELAEKYKNVDTKMFADYEDFDEVTCLPEPPVNCQQLYNILDGCIQSVLLDKNADPSEVLKKAQNDFQINYLDKN